MKKQFCQQLRQRIFEYNKRSDFQKITLATGFLLGGMLLQKYSLDEKQQKQLHKLYSWGYGNFGQLGIGSEQTKHTPEEVSGLNASDIVQIEAKRAISAVVTKEGLVFTWGRNKGKILGIQATTTNIQLPTLVQDLIEEKIVHVSAGPNHMIAINEMGEAFSWGNPEHGKLGHSFEQKEKFISKDHYQTSNRLNQGGNIKKVEGIPQGTKIIMSACGSQHSLLLTDKGEVFSFGQNKQGVLGYESDNAVNKVPSKVDFFNGKQVVRVSAGSDYNLALTSDGKMYGWGNNDYGQLGNGSNIPSAKPKLLYFGGEKIKQFSCGDFFAGAVTSSGKVYTWGYGGDGQLCQKSREHIFTPQIINFQHSVEKITCGSGHVGIITNSSTENGSLFMFGRGREGQLGLGDTIASEATYRTEPKKVIFFENGKVLNVKSGGEHTLAIVEN